MKIDANLLNEFAKITNDKTTNTTPKYVYGTVVKTDGGTFVELDGSTDGIVTPVSMVMDADDGDRVLCSFDNHSVTVVGNLEHPAQSLSSDSAYSAIEKIVGGMVMTSDGVKVFYQEDEPVDSMELPLNPGDTWYKTDPSTGRAFTIYIYTEDHEWVETALTINAVNITGKLSANQINVSNLASEIAKIISLDADRITTGKLSADKIDTKELVVEDANIKSINGNKIEDGTLIAAALSHEAILTASGIKVYYQPEEPTRTLISNTVNGAATSWYEDEEGHIMRDGDTWYKTIKIANDSKDYCQIVYVYNSNTNLFEETPLDAAVLRENSITAREIDVDTLAADKAFMKKLIVENSITAREINVANLSSEIAKIISLDADRITTGKLSANRIDVDTLAANEAFMKKLVVGINVGSTQLLRGTNSYNALVHFGKWNDGNWGRGIPNPENGTMDRVVLSDSPNPLYQNGFHVVNLSSGATYLTISQQDVPVCVGETYTLSTYVKGSGEALLQYGKQNSYFRRYNIDTETWQKIYFTFTIEPTQVNDNSLTDVSFGNTSGDIYFACIKLEKGNVATEWSEYEGDTSVQNVYKTGTTIIDGGKIDTDSLIAKNVLVEDSDNNVIFSADSSTNTVKIGDITVTTDMLDTLTNAIRLATGKALVVSAPNLTISEDGSITAKNGNFTGTVNATSGSFTGTVNATSGSFTGAINATSGSFKGTISAGSTISGSKIVTNGRTALSDSITGLYMNTDGFDYCFTMTGPISSNTTYHHLRLSSAGISIDGILTYDGTTRLAGANIGKMINLNCYMVCNKGINQFINGDGGNILHSIITRKTCTADNISISANSHKSGTISVTATSGYEIFAVGGFSLSNASSSGTGSSNCAVSICNISSVGSSATVTYLINTWSSTAVKVKLVVHCLQRPKI